MRIEIYLNEGEDLDDADAPYFATALEARDLLREFIRGVRIPDENEHINAHVLAAMDEMVLRLETLFTEQGLECWLK